MRRRLASPRFRRRLAWSAALLGLAAALAVGAVVVGNTGHSTATPFSEGNAWVYREPRLKRLTPQERAALLATSAHFVRTAVARRHRDEAWDLLGPEMRAGQTRRSWNSGANNVVPFPVAGIAAWDVLYSYDDDVAFDLALVSEPGHDIVGKTFTIELKRYPRAHDRWLVASWVPRGISGATNSKAAASAAPPPTTTAALSPKWLMLPLSILALIVLTPIVLAIRTLVVSRRATKRYQRELAAHRSLRG
jgi:hypothetical protein